MYGLNGVTGMRPYLYRRIIVAQKSALTTPRCREASQLAVETGTLAHAPSGTRMAHAAGEAPCTVIGS